MPSHLAEQDFPSEYSDQVSKAMTAALNLLSYRMRTTFEIRSRIKDKFGADIIDYVISKLIEQRYLDDTKFAQEWCDNRSKHKPRAKGLLKQELYKLGISDTDITVALDAIDDQTLAYEAGIKLAQRLVDKQTPPEILNKKVHSLLHRRGFNTSVIRDTVRQINMDIGHSES